MRNCVGLQRCKSCNVRKAGPQTLSRIISKSRFRIPRETSSEKICNWQTWKLDICVPLVVPAIRHSERANPKLFYTCNTNIYECWKNGETRKNFEGFAEFRWRCQSAERLENLLDRFLLATPSRITIFMRNKLDNCFCYDTPTKQIIVYPKRTCNLL